MDPQHLVAHATNCPAYRGLLLLGRRTADLLGRRRMFVVGAGLLGAGSLFAGLSGSQGVLAAAHENLRRRDGIPGCS